MVLILSTATEDPEQDSHCGSYAWDVQGSADASSYSQQQNLHAEVSTFDLEELSNEALTPLEKRLVNMLRAQHADKAALVTELSETLLEDRGMEQQSVRPRKNRPVTAR